MSNANCEGILSNDKLGVYGFVFSPDFDTSQQMDIHEFLKSIYKKTCMIHQLEIKFDGHEIPVYVMGLVEKDIAKNIVKNYSNKLVGDLHWEQKRSTDVKDYTDNRYGHHFISLTLDDGSEYLTENERLFFCKIPYKGVIVIVPNPFNAFFKRDELKQKSKDYKENCGMYLKKSFSKTYLEELPQRQKDAFREIKTIFQKFYENVSQNGFVTGSFNMFLSSGYAVFGGTKLDSFKCLSKGVFPYKLDSEKTNDMARLTDAEINDIIKEREEYQRKSDVVVNRIVNLEQKLKEKGYSWTIISKDRIRFEKKEDGSEEWMTWMNAQIFDNANHGWFTEQDFIDWINMEGKIPFHRKQVRHFASILEELTKENSKIEKYTLIEVVPKDQEKKKEYTSYDDYEAKAYMNVGGKKLYYSLEDIKNLIKKYSGKEIEKYTREEFDNEMKKSSKGTTLTSKIKKILTK